MRFIVDECTFVKISVIQRLLAGYADQLVDKFVVVTETKIRFARKWIALWVKKRDEFLILNEKEILTHTGKISHREMEAKVQEELGKFNEQGNGNRLKRRSNLNKVQFVYDYDDDYGH